MTSTFDPAAELAELASLFDEVDALLALAPELVTGVAPGVSRWTVEQHLAHVTLANELVLRNIASLVAGRGALVVRGGEPHPLTIPLLVAGRLPRGEAEAPRMVRPPERVQRELLAGWLADGRRALAALDPATVVPSELKVPHQALGPLDAPQWARFAVVHTRHHLEIAAEVVAALRSAAAGAQ